VDEAVKFIKQVLVISIGERIGREFANDWGEVSERADGRERRSAIRPRESSYGSEQEGRFDDVKREALSNERSGSAYIVLGWGDRCIRELDVKGDDAVEINGI
jgi:hypothetical protein